MSKGKKRNYDEVSVTRALSKKKGCTFVGRTIEVDANQSDLGNSSWGKIDYLVKNHKYVYVIVNTTGNKHNTHKRVNVLKTDEKLNINKQGFDNFKAGKHYAKIDMAGMTKQAMKNSAIG